MQSGFIKVGDEYRRRRGDLLDHAQFFHRGQEAIKADLNKAAVGSLAARSMAPESSG